MSSSHRLGIALLALLIGPGCRGDEVTINAAADTCLFEWTAFYNFGHQADLPAGMLGWSAGNQPLARALYKFDVAAAVPAGATITAAEMTLHVTRAPEPNQNPVASDFALHRVLVDWGEGGKSGEIPGGAPAGAGEATWDNRFHPNDGWSIPGGQLGADFASTVSAMKTDVDAVGAYIFVFNATGIGDLQDMRDNPLQNHGWVLRSMSENIRKTARRWSAREGTDESPPLPQPELRIIWTPAVIPPTITGVSLDPTAGEFSVRIAGLAGQSYQLHTSEDLLTWSPGETKIPTTDRELVFTLPLAPPTNFVRIEASLSP